jgi:hypothetical protein
MTKYEGFLVLLCVVVTVVYVVIHSHSQTNWELSENYRYPTSYDIEELNATLTALRTAVKNAPRTQSHSDKSIASVEITVRAPQKLSGDKNTIENVGTLQNVVNSWNSPLGKDTDVPANIENRDNNAIKRTAVIFTMDSISACKLYSHSKYFLSFC